jgi:hypothetical protein
MPCACRVALSRPHQPFPLEEIERGYSLFANSALSCIGVFHIGRPVVGY